MKHRDQSTRCTLGSKSYCPGELLFRSGSGSKLSKHVMANELHCRMGKRRMKAKICGSEGKFETRKIKRTYIEPQRE